ncbi:MAG: hypothetical protein K8S54_00645 [Spirochaetia bacterium]|nr:hypothetical protein [Spirochaetia bacterium]
MKPSFDQGNLTNLVNNAPGFTHNPGNWDSLVGETTTMAMRIDVTPSSNLYDVWLNGTQRMSSVPFIVPSVPLTHVRIFESHYTDFLGGALAFDAQPPMKFDNLRVFYPAAATIDSEQPKPP